MTFQQLHYILEVAQTGSVSKAAENLFVSRPSIRFCIRSLEEELGYAVFMRTASGLVPTPKGAEILMYARQICDTQRRMTGVGKENRTRIKMLITDHPPVVDAVAQFLKENSRREDVVFTMQSYYDDWMQKLASGEVDIVVRCSLDRPVLKSVDNILVEELYRVPVVVLLGKGHRLYSKKKLTAQDFREEVLLDMPTRVFSNSKTLGDSLPFDPKAAWVVNLTSMREKLLGEGLGFLFRRVPTKEYIDRLGLRCLRLEGVWQYMCCFTRAKRPLSPEAARFLEIVRRKLEDYREPEITEAITPLWMETEKK